MFKRTEVLVFAACAIAASPGAWAADRSAVTRGVPFTGIGRAATPAEIRAWDIDVRPDFKGLPKGSGTVAQGQQIWEGKCASCHGTFGENNEVFTPIVGGTTKDDVRTGHVAALANNSAPQRTTMMKVSTVSTLWDYIHRAMPWNAPKSLGTDDVYAVVAYILRLSDVLPDDFTLSDKNIAEVQALMPNRNGMTRDHGLWDVHGKPDVKSVACMKGCPGGKVWSSLPDFAKDSNGNPADQTRPFGETHGVNLASANKAPAADAISPTPATPDGLALITSSGCVACHGVNNKIVGPAFTAVRDRYKSRGDAESYMIKKIKAGGSGVWGAIPMPPQSQVKETDLKAIVRWILTNDK